MNKTILVFLIFFVTACKSNQGMKSQKADEIFTLNTTSCMGPCPVFKLSLYGDKKLVFEGKENTALRGEHETFLTDEQFDSLLGIIDGADWLNLEDEYKSKMLDLPTQNFTYNRNGITKSVIRYGAGPESISNMSDVILTFVQEQVFETE